MLSAFGERPLRPNRIDLGLVLHALEPQVLGGEYVRQQLDRPRGQGRCGGEGADDFAVSPIVVAEKPCKMIAHGNEGLCRRVERFGKAKRMAKWALKKRKGSAMSRNLQGALDRAWGPDQA